MSLIAILVILLPFLGLVFAVALGVYGGLALYGGLRRSRKDPEAEPSRGRTGLAIGGLAAVGVATLVGAFCAAFIGQMGLVVFRNKTSESQEESGRSELQTIAAAQTAYRSVNGGYYDTPACLAHPEVCIPGYAGSAFLDAQRASLSSRNGYSFTFQPGAPAPRSATISPSSVSGYAVMARPAQSGLLSYCVDARARVCDSLRAPEPSHGICPCTTAETHVYPLVLEFRHVVGDGACPESVGTVLITNGTRRTITTDVRTASPFLSFGPNVTLEPLVSSSVEVFFNCQTRRNFDAEIEALMPQDVTEAAAFESKVRLFGTVVQ